MDQLAQSTVIAAIGDRPVKRTFNAATDWTGPQAIDVAVRVRRKHTLAANGADFAVERMNLIETIRADREPRNVQLGFAANAAIGGKENGEEAFSGTLGPDSCKIDVRRNNTRPCDCNGGLASPGSVLTTAEDSLLALPPAKCRHGPIRTTFAV